MKPEYIFMFPTVHNVCVWNAYANEMEAIRIFFTLRSMCTVWIVFECKLTRCVMRRMMVCFSSQHEDDEKEGMTHLILNHPTRADYCIFIIYAQHRVSQLLSGSQTSECFMVYWRCQIVAYIPSKRKDERRSRFKFKVAFWLFSLLVSFPKNIFPSTKTGF